MEPGRRRGTLLFSELRIREAKGQECRRQLWKLEAPLTYSQPVNGNRNSGTTITVPAGFVTDFASVPWPLWPLVPPTGPWNKASVIHDYLCKHPKVSRFWADATFRECMYRLGVPAWRRVLMYYAVRCYGALFVRKP